MININPWPLCASLAFVCFGAFTGQPLFYLLACVALGASVRGGGK